jgi:hypothetical protein
MRVFLGRLIGAFAYLTSRKQVVSPYGIIDVADVQPLVFSMESFTGVKLPKRSWWAL